MYCFVSLRRAACAWYKCQRGLLQWCVAECTLRQTEACCSRLFNLGHIGRLAIDLAHLCFVQTVVGGIMNQIAKDSILQESGSIVGM